MDRNAIIAALNAEIDELTAVRDLMAGSQNERPRGPGRPKGSSSKATSFDPKEFAPKRRTMSAEGKARIAEAQRRRWAAQKSGGSKKVAKAVPSTQKTVSRPTKRTEAKGSKAPLNKATMKKSVARRSPAKKGISAAPAQIGNE